MTALASSLLAALPGGFAPFAGAAVVASAGVAGAFDGLLAGLLTAETDARPRTPGLPDETLADADRTAPDALVPSGNALMAFATAPAPAPLPPPSPAAVSPTTAESGATVTPDAPRPSPVAALRAGPASPVPAPANARATLTELAGIETGLLDLTAPPAAAKPVDAPNAIAALAAQGWNRPHRPAPGAAPAAAPAATAAPAPTPTTAVTVRPDIEIAARPAAAPSTAAPAIPAQPVSTMPAQPALPAVPPLRTQTTAADAIPLAAPVKAVAPEGETRRPAIASRGDRLAQAAARPGLTPTARSDHPAPVETAAMDLAAVDGDEAQAIAPDTAPIELAEAPEARPPALLAEARAAAVSTAGAVAPETLVRGSPETVAKLAADIVRKLDGQTTRFDLELDPHGLGKVNVAIEIDRAGKMTAALTFDSPQSAADLRGRSGELRLALERAGFDISEGGLTFDLAGQGPGFGGREAAQQERGWNGRAFQRAQSGAEEADAALAAVTQPPSRTRSGIDIRI
jgi:hypothetical protein